MKNNNNETIQIDKEYDKLCEQLKQLEVLCEVLFGINNQQINIIHVTHKGERKSYELIYPKNTTQFNF